MISSSIDRRTRQTPAAEQGTPNHPIVADEKPLPFSPSARKGGGDRLPPRHQGGLARDPHDRQCGRRTARRAYIIGVNLVRPTVFSLPTVKTERRLDIAVTRNLNAVSRAAIKQATAACRDSGE